jgi:hypothetical protein
VIAVYVDPDAAPLLDLLGLDSFTVDVSGRSTRGKTTAARTAMSVWADPGERGDGLFSWRTTRRRRGRRNPHRRHQRQLRHRRTGVHHPTSP